MSLRIAVADDEADIRDFLTRVLERLGHNVLEPASTGRELVELCRDQQPDLVITDLRMPDMSGDEALREIVEDRCVPFIIISAFGPPDSLEFDHCQWVYLNKPVKRIDLEKAIKKLLH